MPTPRYTHTCDASAQGAALLRHEWLLTNGSGAFSAGTALGVNTRRYHGLLIAATTPPVGRLALVNQCFEQLALHARMTGGVGEPGGSTSDASGDAAGGAAGGVEQVIELSTMIFPGDDGAQLLIPDGHEHLAAFKKGLSVRWEYRWGPVAVARELFLHWREQAATLAYTVTGLEQLPADACRDAVLRISPMLALRDFHAMLKTDHAGPVDVFEHDAAVTPGPTITVRRAGIAATLRCSAGTFIPNADWWYNLHYPIDRRRGQDDCEDHFVPGRFEVPLDATSDNRITLTLALGDQPAAPRPDTKARARHLKPIIERLHAHAPNAHALPAAGPSTLAQSSDDFVVQRTVRGKTLSTILAGYPWFADWGRDTFIALPGILLSTGRFDEARATLRAFAEAIGTGEHEGLVPNRFDDYDDSAAHYNTVDASLWFIHAAMAYAEQSGDDDAWAEWLAPACVRIAEAYAHGTAFGIRMDDDGLITAGDRRTQLTWMDAAAAPPGSSDLHIFTARHGKAVEINALWFNALQGLSETLPDALAATAGRFGNLANKTKRSFNKVFWNDDAGCLFDHVYVDEQGHTVRDASVRPNQCFAVSLPRSPLSKARQQSVMRVVTDKLLTPMGLRTLAADDPAFHPWYAGNQYERDAAYHQGTIWPWLIGPYAEGLLRAGGFSDQAKRDAAGAIEPLLSFMAGRGLGQLYEIHQAQPVDGQHPPRGCFAQAWSVAEVLRIHAMLGA